MSKIGDDLRAFKQRDPACRNLVEVALLYPGFHAILFHRIAHWLYQRKWFFLARLISQFSRFLTGLEIQPGAKIGRGLVIDHGSGVVIGETTEIGDNCTLYQGVTLGGTGKDVGKRHPTLGNDVLIGSGSRVLGPIKVGDHAKIAAGAVVLAEVPPYATAVGVPAKVVRIAGKKVEDPDKKAQVNRDLDHVHIPDPVAAELQRLAKLTEELQRRVDELEGGKPAE